MKTEYITEEGKRLLELRLKSLIQARKLLTEEVGNTATFGDIGYENAEFDAAIEALEIKKAEIAKINYDLSSSRIETIPKRPVRASFGTKVTILDLSNKTTYTYRIVGPYETNALNQEFLNKDELTQNSFISYVSPIGRALIGKEVGDVVRCVTPTRCRELELINIESCFEGLDT